MYKRILAIGDIHGEYDKLLALYEKIRFNPPDDLLVFVGDYIDRGKKSPEVLQWLMERRNEPNIVMLRGNHEQMMLDFYLRKDEQKRLGGPFAPTDYGGAWLLNDNGGKKTKWRLKYKKQSADGKWYPSARAEICPFFAGLPFSFRVEAGGREFFFCHAGVNPAVPLEEQDPVALLGAHPKDFMLDYTGTAVLVVGHTPVENIHDKDPEALLRNEPIIRDNMIFLDTGACYRDKLGDTRVRYDRPLSCVDVLSGRIWQSGSMERT